MTCPPSSVMAASKDTRVLVEGFSNMRARVLPFKGAWGMPLRRLFLRSIALLIMPKISSFVRSDIFNRCICFSVKRLRKESFYNIFRPDLQRGDGEFYFGSWISRSLQIFRASLSTISVCLGTADVLRVATLKYM